MAAEQPELLRIRHIFQADSDPKNLCYELQRVELGNIRVLTVITADEATVSKWFKDVFSSPGSNTRPFSGDKQHFRPDTIFIGVRAEHHVRRSPLPERIRPGDEEKRPFDFITFSTGSHCLIYQTVPPQTAFKFAQAPTMMKRFFDNQRVVVLGTNMATIAAKLNQFHGVVIKNFIDISELAGNPHERPETLYNLGEMMFVPFQFRGTIFGLPRPPVPLSWWIRRPFVNQRTRQVSMLWSYNRVNQAKVKFSTYEAWLCLTVGIKLLHIEGPPPGVNNIGKGKISKHKGL